MTGPLSGLKIVALAGLGPGPFACMLLADMGADVVRVVKPGDTGSRYSPPPEQDVVNRGTQFVVVDLKSAAGVEQVLRLAAQADVFIEGFRPGVIERMGVGPEVLHRANPGLVVARLTGYGQDGALMRKAGHDINYVAQSGVLHMLRPADGPPVPPLNLLGDYGGGAVAALGIVAAVLQARMTGIGQVVDAAMIDSVAIFGAKLQGLRAAGLFGDVPGSSFLAGGAPHYRAYECADGRYLAVGALEPQFYAAFLDGLGVDVAGFPDRNEPAAWPDLSAAIAEVMVTRSRDEWLRIYDGTDACVSPVLTYDEVAADRHNEARGLYEDVEGVLHPAPAPRFDRTPSRRPQPSSRTPSDVEAIVKQWERHPRGRHISYNI
ncbi:CaiB/BaiF CoA transferase family protein [Mycobacterium sp. C31M]